MNKYAGRVVLVGLVVLCGCKTRSELRREQEYEQIKQEVRNVKNSKVDVEVVSEELRNEITRLSTAIDDLATRQETTNAELRKEIEGLKGRFQAMDDAKRVQEETDQKLAAEKAERGKPTLENAQRLFDEKQFEEASEMLRNVLKENVSHDEKKKAQYLLAESLFASKDFASAALEYTEFKKTFAKDPLVPQATIRQGQCFKSMGKSREAKLFFQEFLDRFPKHELSARAKKEMRRLKN